jgi:hypothetical protein
VLQLTRFKGPRQANPFLHVAAVQNISIGAWHGRVEGPLVGRGRLAHFGNAFVEQVLDVAIKLLLRVVSGRKVPLALECLPIGNVTEHIGGVAQNQGHHDFTGPHVVGRAFGLCQLNHGRNVAAYQKVRVVEGWITVGGRQEKLVGPSGIGRAGAYVLRDKSRSQRGEALNSQAVADDARQQVVRSGFGRAVGVRVFV